MIPKTVTALIFSPTGTTKTIGDAIINGINGVISEYIDITDPDKRKNIKQKICSDILVLGFPVYEEHIPDQVKKYLISASIDVHAAIIYCVYGNVAYGKSLKEAYKILENKNARIISLGAFVGEHSFATKEVPIGIGRPNKADVEKGTKLGEISATRYDADEFIEEKNVPENMLLLGRIMPKNSVRRVSLAPIVNTYTCTTCNLCIKKCPMGAINKEYLIEENKCIRCYACVRACTSGARKIEYKGNIIKNMLIKMNKKNKESIII